MISVPPKIEYDAKYKQAVALSAGATLTLPVTVSGVPTPKVSWYFGDKELKPGNGTTIDTKDKASTLTIKNTSGANAGDYRVKAENSAGLDEAVFKVSMKGKLSCQLMRSLSAFRITSYLYLVRIVSCSVESLMGTGEICFFILMLCSGACAAGLFL